jgi:hypothetical protein
MKKIPALLFLTVFAICVQAQTIIPKAGLTLSQFSEEDDTEFPKNKLGFTFGIGVNFELNEIFSLQPELNFIQKGARFEVNEELNGERYNAKSKLTINYVEIPLLVRASFGESTKFYISAGPSLGIGVGGKYSVKATQSSMGLSVTGKVNGKVKFGDEPTDYVSIEDGELYIPKRLDVGLQLGIGTIIAEKVMIDIRYGIGLTNLYDEDDSSVFNRAFQFTLGIPINLK